jgi:hypothetical protein
MRSIVAIASYSSGDGVARQLGLVHGGVGYARVDQLSGKGRPCSLMREQIEMYFSFVLMVPVCWRKPQRQ